MLAQTAARARLAAPVARRGFTTTRVRPDQYNFTPYHYPEGPRTNLPFNTQTRFFAVRYWAFMITGFSLPFGIAIYQTNKTK